MSKDVKQPVLIADCCAKQNIRHMPFKLPMFPVGGVPQVNMVNSVCLTCKTHWHGPESEVYQYTAKEWETHIAEALEYLKQRQANGHLNDEYVICPIKEDV